MSRGIVFSATQTRFLVAAWSLCAFVSAGWAQAQFYEVTPPVGGHSPDIFALSADGTAAAGSYAGPDTLLRPLLWTMARGSIDLAGGTQGPGDAAWCSGAGVVAIGFGTVGTSLQGWTWTQESGIVPFRPPQTGGMVVPLSISEDGLAVVGLFFNGSTTTFRWTEGMGFQSLPQIGADMRPMVISADGSTVVGTLENGRLAFAWRSDIGGLEIPLRFPYMRNQDTWGYTYGNVSYDGRFIVGASDGAAGIYDIDTSTLTILAWPDGSPVLGSGTAASADGTIVVGNVDDGQMSVFLWDAEHGARDLDDVLRAEYGLDVGQLNYVRSMSADGAVFAGGDWVVALHAPAPYRGRPPCQGDVDGDQRVGLSDLLFVLGEWRRPEPDLGADITGDGIVDQLDLNIVLVDFGDDCARRRIQQAGR
ncbi:MAG: hypothetical protein AMXMBFR47_19470 [Planctomycetota bacterium]